ncbi:hypothetical protein H2203_002277, partial [Taxawa tesnikishii (nom. ined.)]
RWNLNNPFRSDGDELRRIRYDLINSRFLAEGIDATRWPAYIRDLRGRLTEGGWLQMLEFNLNIQSDSGRREEAHSLVTWMDHYSQAMQRLQRDPLVGNKLQQYMAAAGLVDVRYERQRLPIGPWLGAQYISLEVMKEILKATGIWACCHVFGMTPQQFNALVDGAVREMANPALKLYVPL